MSDDAAARREALTREAREARGPAIDWDRVDRDLFARLDAEGPAQRSVTRTAGRAWIAVGATAAAAAIAALVFGRGSATPRATASAPMVVAEGASGAAAERTEGPSVVARVRGILGPAGDLRTNGAAAGARLTLAAGTVIEGGLAGGVFVVEGALACAVEGGARARVARAAAPLVVELERGAIEADVDSTATGEAFAVDVDGMRVAVHGTHLRVESRAGRLVLDLREGSVVVGRAPRRGLTAGRIVTAPAHLELDPKDPDGTWSLSNDPLRVRAPLDLARPAPPSAAPPGSLDTFARPPAAAPPPRAALDDRRAAALRDGPKTADPPAAAAPAAAEARTPGAAPPIAAGVEEEAHAPESAPPEAPSAPAAASTGSAPPRHSPPASRASRGGLTKVVRDCWFSRSEGAGPNATTLTIDVGEDGALRATSFDPAVPPAVSACTARALGATRLTPGRMALVIDFSR